MVDGRWLFVLRVFDIVGYRAFQGLYLPDQSTGFLVVCLKDGISNKPPSYSKIQAGDHLYC